MLCTNALTAYSLNIALILYAVTCKCACCYGDIRFEAPGLQTGRPQIFFMEVLPH